MLDMFLGSAAAQQRATAALVENIHSREGGIYVILGATRTGKNTAFKNAAQEAEANGVAVMSDLAGEEHALGKPAALQLLHRTSGNLIRMESDLEAQFLAQRIGDARAVLKEFPGSTVVIDALLHEHRLPFASGKLPSDVAQD